MHTEPHRTEVAPRAVVLVAAASLALGVAIGLGIGEWFGHAVVAVALGLCVMNTLLLAGAVVLRHRGRDGGDPTPADLRDGLTRLANRASLTAAGTEALARSAAPGHTVALMLVDLDRFKDVNDSLGHGAGDRLLTAVADRLSRAVRDEDTVARLGSDEFAVLIPHVSNPAVVDAIAAKIRDVFATPFLLDDLRLSVDASIGVAVSPDHGTEINTLLQHADAAMQAAKHARAGLRMYDASKDPRSRDRLTLISELRDAIGQGQLTLHYQPKALLADGRVEGVEALCRWVHPERGFIPPNDFIPLAEETGLIKPITLWVVDEALRQAAEWRANGVGLAISVNISVQNLHDPTLNDEIASRLERWGADSDWIRLEITESAIMEDTHGAIRRLTGLADMGLELAMDDYGTGYSSLAHLKRMPLTELKIDRSFVTNLMADQTDALIVGSTVELGHSLGLRVVAEGVETEDEWAGLQMLGCDIAQGFFLGRPMPPDQLIAWLHASGREYVQVTSDANWIR
jgi:diguanylate cyclase (GGDEF)-like protein